MALDLFTIQLTHVPQVISGSDGQVFLETELFYKERLGMWLSHVRVAVWLGSSRLSVEMSNHRLIGAAFHFLISIEIKTVL